MVMELQRVPRVPQDEVASNVTVMGGDLAAPASFHWPSFLGVRLKIQGDCHLVFPTVQLFATHCAEEEGLFGLGEADAWQ